MSPPEPNEHEEITDDEPVLGPHRTFVTANAEFFAQSLAPVNELFRNSGMMNIVSEEEDYTIVVGVREADEGGVMDVDCVSLEPRQESLRECIDTLFIEE